MITIQTWSDVITTSFQNLWTNFIAFLPNFIGAVIVLIVGVIIAIGLGQFVARIVKLLKIDQAVERLGFKEVAEKGGFKINVANALGWLVKWFLIIVFLIAASDILKLEQVTLFLSNVVLYIPNVVIAIVVLLLGILFGNWAQQAVSRVVKAAQLLSAEFLAGIAKWAIIIFSFMAALVQLKIAPDLIQTLFTGFVAMLAIAGGLAFGLGGQNQASRFLEKLRRDISSENQ